MTKDQEIAFAKLIGAMEGVIYAGVCSEDNEFMLRAILAEVLAAFHLPSQTELEQRYAN